MDLGAAVLAAKDNGLLIAGGGHAMAAGLSVRPTLSVRARSDRPVAATVTLSYLASGFDWQAMMAVATHPRIADTARGSLGAFAGEGRRRCR